MSELIITRYVDGKEVSEEHMKGMVVENSALLDIVRKISNRINNNKDFSQSCDSEYS